MLEERSQYNFIQSSIDMQEVEVNTSLYRKAKQTVSRTPLNQGFLTNAHIPKDSSPMQTRTK